MTHPLKSLFARLLMLQVIVAVLLLVVFGALVYVERNVAVARLVAERWAPALRAAAGVSAVAPPVARALLHSAEQPTPALRSMMTTPRMAALEDELRRQGLQVDDLLIARGPVLWLRLRGAQAGHRWVGLADDALLPRVPGRLMLALLLSAALLVAVSWYFTRRLTRPLEQLRVRMQAQRPGEAPDARPTDASATPEVAAIGAAYNALLDRYARHERERALLLAGVSHDLRAPLSRIRLAAGLLPDDPGVAARRDAIERNTEVADRLIGSFLDHVRAGELALDTRADLAEIARRVADGFAHEGRPVAVDVPAALPVEQTQPLLLERLLANLLDNAFRHGAEPVSLRVAQQGGEVLVEVGDAGPGVAPDRQAEVLQAFARGDTSRGTPGTGLGLAIVARVAERMGGSVGFDRAGARHLVRVRWPLSR